MQIARARKTVNPKEADRIEQTIEAYGPLPPFRATAENLLDAAGRDKKNRAGLRRFVLPQGIGNAVVVENVTDTEMISAIRWTLDQARGRT
jgi:3-dehydroquinate synthase